MALGRERDSFLISCLRNRSWRRFSADFLLLSSDEDDTVMCSSSDVAAAGAAASPKVIVVLALESFESIAVTIFVS